MPKRISTSPVVDGATVPNDTVTLNANAWSTIESALVCYIEDEEDEWAQQWASSVLAEIDSQRRRC